MGTAEVSRESREMVPYQNELQEKESQIQVISFHRLQKIDVTRETTD